MATNNQDTSFVFRLQTENKGQHDLKNTLNHWDDSCMYNDKQINAIESSNKESLNRPTSIPSPFAHIALVKTAFAEVAEYGDKALKSYQKVVSDTLDVAEIFFTLDKWKHKVEVIKWNKAEDLKKLEAGHRQLYKTLKTFLENDAHAYNFDRMECIYILKYKATGRMIGATSPCTLFFSSANNLDDVDIQLNNNHKAFDGIVPLSERSWDFQKYFYTWIAMNDENHVMNGGTAISRFQELKKYLEKQKLLIGRTEEIDKIQEHPEKELSNSYKELRAPDVEVLGKNLHQSKEVTEEYLNVMDLLEDKIIRLNYEIKKDSFFDGNLQDNTRKTYLLPIKDVFFKHYSIDDLKKSIRINHSGDVVDVELKIKSESYKKRYTKSAGEVVEPNFDCAIFPNVKFVDDKAAHYRFGLICDFEEKERFGAQFINLNTAIEDSQKRVSTRNETYSSNFQLINYSLEGANFDYIRVNYDKSSGIVLPLLQPKAGEEEFIFAVDFGTTNTHIEYKIGSGNQIKAFDISKHLVDEKQIHWLHGGEDDMKRVFDEEYIPVYTDEEFKFPMRSALSYGEKTNWKDVYPFEKACVNVLYEKRFNYPYNKTVTDLKWSDKGDNEKQVKVYIDSIMYLLRNKVIIGNGNLKRTQIRWFYPVSMDRERHNNLESAWKAAYKKYFGEEEGNIISITESVAPFEYYIKDGDASNLVTIDIGGGTTDIVISTTGEVDYITSFRFAANAIFGDGYAENSRVKNGLVRQFIDEIKTDLQTKINTTDDLFRVFDDMKANKSSADIASFLFSLKQNKKVRAAGENLAENANLSKKLENDSTQRIIFIFFYTAIIYHLAKLMKVKNLPMPEKIVFSGNGSRVISFFTNDEYILNGFTKLIFEKVYGEKYPKNNLEIILNKKNPKEATCKGGLFIDKAEKFSHIFKKKVVLHSDGTNRVIQRDNDALAEADTYKVVDDKYIEQTVKEAETFINFVFDLLSFFANEGSKLNADSIKTAKEICFQKLDTYAKNGWKLKQNEVTEEEAIEETLFFYPLVGMLKALSDKICNDNLSKTK